MNEKLPLPLRSARMSVLSRALTKRPAESFPLTLEFPGDGQRGPTMRTFANSEELDAVFRESQVNAVMDGLAIYTLPNADPRQGTGILLADRAAHDPWGDAVQAVSARNWLGIERGWLRGARRSA